MFKYAAVTGSGMGQGKNEDRIMVCGNYLSDGELSGESSGAFLAIVCDGVGGEDFGAEAAGISAMSFINLCGKKMSSFDLSGAVFNANDVLLGFQALKGNMFTTLAGLYIDEDHYCAFNAGNTRIYQKMGKRLIQLSTDHIRNEGLTDMAGSERKSYVITSYLGGLESKCSPSIKYGESNLNSGGKYILCTDGVHEVMTDEEILIILGKPRPLIDRCRMIYNKAIMNNSLDNISIVLVEA